MCLLNDKLEDHFSEEEQEIGEKRKVVIIDEINLPIIEKPPPNFFPSKYKIKMHKASNYKKYILSSTKEGP